MDKLTNKLEPKSQKNGRSKSYVYGGLQSAPSDIPRPPIKSTTDVLRPFSGTHVPFCSHYPTRVTVSRSIEGSNVLPGMGLKTLNSKPYLGSRLSGQLVQVISDK